MLNEQHAGGDQGSVRTHSGLFLAQVERQSGHLPLHETTVAVLHSVAALRGECFLDQGTGFPQLGSSPVVIGTQLDNPLLDASFGFRTGLGDLTIQRADLGVSVFLQLLQLRLRLAGQLISLALTSLMRVWSLAFGIGAD